MATWQRTAGGPTKAEVAEGAAKRGMLRGPAQENRSATFARLKEISDYVSGTMLFAAFREAGPKRKPLRGRV